jgi:Immune inhibitor A peptidase M6
VTEDANARVLIVAAEDRTGASSDPAYASTAPDTPNFLSSYESALDANGITHDVYDVDASGREAPDHLGVLSHYDAVIWYSGNDVVTREPGWGPGNASRLANDMTLEMRQYLNEGGKLLYTGQWAGALENGVAGAQYYDPYANEQCVVGGALVLARCKLIADKNDFIQYYLSSYLYNSDAGTDENGQPVPVEGASDPFTGVGWAFNGGDSAANQIHTASFITTSSLLKPDRYPQFASTAPANWMGPEGAFEPIDGQQYMYSQRADVSYKRLSRTLDLTGAASPTLNFRTSYDAETGWDHVFVEVHTVGQDNWTTLPDANGHTTTETGDSCAEGWFELHPWLERYQGTDCSGTNPATGGAWNSATGRSDGWEDWSIDLSAYAGQQIEVSITYASDWGTQGVGTFVDAIEVSTGEGSTSFEEDGDPMDGWTVPGPAEGSAINANDWTRTESVGFSEGAVTATDDTLHFGFGLEGISGADSRATVLGRSIDYLLD